MWEAKTRVKTIAARWAAPAACLVLCIGTLMAICLPYLPTRGGTIGVDYGFWLPNLLAGDYWHWHAPAWSLPWFTPSECGGVPLHADPQGAYLSLPQFLSFVMPPLQAVRITGLAYAIAAFVGTQMLARHRFACSRPAALLAAALFTLNGFFTARLLVGHLSFLPFALVPALAVCLLGQPCGKRAETWRVVGGALLVAAFLQSGSAVLLPPALFSLVVLAVLHALFAHVPLRPAPLRHTVCRGLGALALAAALCAGKLAAIAGLMSHLTRDAYPLPGFLGFGSAAITALRALFWAPSAAMSASMVNSALDFEVHEFDYRVGPVPLVLFAAVAALAWRRRLPPRPAPANSRLLWEALALLLLIPIALNTYIPPWTAFLKLIPILRSASSMLRWFAAYMPPAAIGAALALDRIAQPARAPAWLLSVTGILVTCLCALGADRSFYDPDHAATYDPSPIATAWRTGLVPPITSLDIPKTPSGTPDMSSNRGNLLTTGRSPLLCYDPIFGYRLEAFRQGTLHPGPILDETARSGRQELNLKNPACYVYPAANACTPGDTFTTSQRGQAQSFAAYEPFAFAKPWWAQLADWTGIATALFMAAVAGGLLLTSRRRTA